jgi:hypothetical protein
MAGTNKYNLDELDDHEEVAESASSQHLASAQAYLFGLLRGYGVQASLLGGYSLYLRGSRRETTVIDAAVEASMRDVQGIIRDERR